LRSLVADLGSEVVLKDTELINFVFNNEGLLGVEAETSVGAQRGSLVEHVEVTDSELLVHALSHFEFSSLFRARALVVDKFDGSRSSLTLDSELDEVRVGDNSESFIEGVKFFADLGELSRVDSHN
jgi:hypothetical protein